ncbi:sialidase family protein [Arenibacter latericius]|uniref:sialidase family protein n=1 Tax=Arenibacter latericius TaxID=86104 RepID=UPI00040913E6|nr:sialidase family protein [Arenibacter latericius]
MKLFSAIQNLPGTFLYFVGVFFISVSLFAQKQQYGEEYIFPFQGQHVHASSIVELPNGDLLSCWFQGSGERKSNDVVINGSKLKKGSNKWSEPFLLADTPGQPDCNPVLFLDAKGKLYLFWIVVQANRWERSILKYKVATDYMKADIPKWEWQDVILLKPDEAFEKTIEAQFKAMPSRGLTWAEYAPKYESMIIESAKDKTKKETGWMTRIHPTVLPSGRILLPLYSDGYNLSLIGISDDNGATWEPSLPIVGYGNIQPSLVQKKDGSLIAYMRDNGDAPGRILESISKDDGYSWTPASESNIPNPGTSVETIVLKNGNWIMVYNDIESGRYSLAVSVSDDEGKTWKWTRNLENEINKEGSFSYPSMIQSKDDLIHITYSYHLKGNKTIKHVAFPLEWVKENK